MQQINVWLKCFYKLEICQSKIDLIHCSVIEFPMQDLMFPLNRITDITPRIHEMQGIPSGISGVVVVVSI